MNPGEAKLGLFDVEVAKPAPLFIVLRDDPRFQRDRQQVESMWARYEPYADPGFRQGFARNPLNRVWEMRLGGVLLDLRFTLSPARSRGPDITATAPHQLIIEATSASRGHGDDQVPEPVFGSEEARPVPGEHICLRILNAIKEKCEQRATWRDISEATPYVIAVSVGEIIEATTNGVLPLSVASCLGIKNFLFEVTGSGAVRPLERPAIPKMSGASVEADIFRRPEYAGISGVIIDGFRLLSTPQHGGGTEYLHNPSAANPLPQGWLCYGTEYWVENGVLKSEDHDSDRER